MSNENTKQTIGNKIRTAVDSLLGRQSHDEAIATDLTEKIQVLHAMAESLQQRRIVSTKLPSFVDSYNREHSNRDKVSYPSALKAYSTTVSLIAGQTPATIETLVERYAQSPLGQDQIRETYDVMSKLMPEEFLKAQGVIGHTNMKRE